MESNDIISREMALGAMLGSMVGTGYQSLAMGVIRMLPALESGEVMGAQWVSVTNRLPKQKGRYIVNCRHRVSNGEKSYTYDYINIIHFRGKTQWATGTDCISHWMDLPPFPEEEFDEEEQEET